MSLYRDLEYRGILKQVTDPGLEKRLEKPMTLYCGFDPTSDSLHVGSLLPLLTLKRFQQAGHRPIAVVGGATGMIGDPSGKTQERQLLTEEILAKNLKGISGVISKFLDLKTARVVNNADWFKGMDYIRFLRDIGKHFTINYMMAKESVRARLEDREHGISYTEFSYMLLQAYDFYVLNRDHGCELQIGGSDQWGNITAGIELIRRMRAAQGLVKEDAPADTFGLTHPLVSKADGTKFGKSEKGNIWLDPNRTHPNEFYQFFVQTADADVLTYLKFFTFLSKEKIEELGRELKAKPEARVAQKALARELTVMVHGEEACARAEQTAAALFGGGVGKGGGVVGILKTLKGSPSQVRDELSKSVPELQATAVAKTRLGSLTLVELLVETKLSGSKGAARKDIEGGGIYLNDERVSDVALTIGQSSLIQGHGLVLRKGKKTHHYVYFE